MTLTNGKLQKQCAIADEIIDEIIRNERRRDSYLYPVRPVVGRLRDPRSYMSHPEYSVDIWEQEYLADMASRVAHDKAKDQHINRVRGKNC